MNFKRIKDNTTADVAKLFAMLAEQSKVGDSRAPKRDWSKGDYSREINAVKEYAKTAEDGKFKDFVSKGFETFRPNDWQRAFDLMQKDQELHGKLPTIFYHPEYEIEDSAYLDCGDLLLGAAISNLSDNDVIIMWETSYATDGERKDFMDYMSERIDLPESLDDFVYDYMVHSHVDTDSVLALLNEWLPSDTKREMCEAFVNMSKIDNTKKVDDSVDETLNTYRRLVDLFEAKDWSEFDKTWSNCSEDCKKVIIENSEDDPEEFKARLK